MVFLLFIFFNVAVFSGGHARSLGKGVIKGASVGETHTVYDFFHGESGVLQKLFGAFNAACANVFGERHAEMPFERAA